MDDFHKIGLKVGALKKDYADLKEISSVAKTNLKQQRNDIDDLIECLFLIMVDSFLLFS